MKKIMMTKYGFVRWPSEDFSDDGNRFTCYKAGERVRVSKLVSDGEVYIDATIYGTKLPYDVYRKLPHYSAMSRLNGVSAASLTDADLEQLYNDCLKYEQEYAAAEQSIQLPTLAEIMQQCKRIQDKATLELVTVEQLMGKYGITAALILNDWEWKELRSHITSLANRIKTFDPNTYAELMFGKSRSFDFCKTTNSDLSDSYYYDRALKLFGKVEDSVKNSK